MTTQTSYLNRASSGGDGTTNNTSGSTAAFASMSSAEANMGGSATDDYILNCCGSSADTTAVTWDFPTNLTTGTLTIRGHATDPAGKYNGTATISTSHYRLAPTGSVSALAFQESNITLDGIQIECQGGSFRAGVLIAILTNTTYAIRNCRIRASGACDSGIGTGGAGVGANCTLTIENNLVVGFDLQQIEYIADNFRTPAVTIRQNTLYGDGSSVGIKIANSASNAGATYVVKGNAIANSGASNCFNITTVGGGTVTYDDNATEDAQGTTGEIAIGTLSNAWTSPGTGQSADFTVKNTSSTLYSAVNPTLVTTDITGFSRDGSSHDVGCFEYQASGASGTAAFTLAGDTIAAAGTSTLLASSAFTLAGDLITASGSVGSSITGSAAFTLAGDVLAASSNVGIVTSAGITLNGDTLAASVTTTVLSTAAITLSGVGMAASGSSGTSTFTFPPCAIYLGGNIAIGTNGQPIVLIFV